MDTGACSSFINPELFPSHKIETINPIKIKTVLNEHTLNKQITLPIFKEFKQNGEFSFLLFKFHNYFDGLLGLDALTKLGARVDLQNNILITKNSKLTLHMKPNYTSNTYNIPANTKLIVKLPVDIENDDIFVGKIEIKTDLYIPEGIYQAKSWCALFEVINVSHEDQTFLIEQPIKAKSFSSKDYLEINNFNITSNKEISENSDQNLINSLRVSHLNKEEKKLLFNTVREFDDIFPADNQKLTFTNNCKHRIITTDDIPIHTKSYRYPYVHKEEIKTQISDMLHQGIIRPSYSPWSSPVWIVKKNWTPVGSRNGGW